MSGGGCRCGPRVVCGSWRARSGDGGVGEKRATRVIALMVWMARDLMCVSRSWAIGVGDEEWARKDESGERRCDRNLILIFWTNPFWRCPLLPVCALDYSCFGDLILVQCASLRNFAHLWDQTCAFSVPFECMLFFKPPLTQPQPQPPHTPTPPHHTTTPRTPSARHAQSARRLIARSLASLPLA